MTWNWNSFFKKPNRPKLKFPPSIKKTDKFPTTVTSIKRLKLPSKWKPSAKMRRIHIHWTAGSHTASSLDKKHYHVLVEGDGEVIRGHIPIDGNEPPLRSGKYAAHTRKSNSYAIGIGLCAMIGATTRPLRAGKYPITPKQWNAAVGVAADLCRHYNIEVTDKTVLTHAEVQKNLGIRQNGKWDIAWLPFWNKKLDAKAVGDKFRSEVKALL